MSKLRISLILILLLFTLCGCSNVKSQGNIDSESLETYETAISNYLNALSKKDINTLKKYSTEALGNSFNDDTLTILNETLASAKLLKCTIRENKFDKIILDADVEVICYENSIPAGDWKPGKSISVKSFELIKEDNHWKVNGLGVY